MIQKNIYNSDDLIYYKKVFSILELLNLFRNKIIYIKYDYDIWINKKLLLSKMEYSKSDLFDDSLWNLGDDFSLDRANLVKECYQIKNVLQTNKGIDNLNYINLLIV